jgi:hypothetical protein
VFSDVLFSICDVAFSICDVAFSICDVAFLFAQRLRNSTWALHDQAQYTTISVSSRSFECPNRFSPSTAIGATNKNITPTNQSEATQASSVLLFQTLSMRKGQSE